MAQAGTVQGQGYFHQRRDNQAEGEKDSVNASTYWRENVGYYPVYLYPSAFLCVGEGFILCTFKGLHYMHPSKTFRIAIISPP